MRKKIASVICGITLSMSTLVGFLAPDMNVLAAQVPAAGQTQDVPEAALGKAADLHVSSEEETVPEAVSGDKVTPGAASEEETVPDDTSENGTIKQDTATEETASDTVLGEEELDVTTVIGEALDAAASDTATSAGAALSQSARDELKRFSNYLVAHGAYAVGAYSLSSEVYVGTDGSNYLATVIYNQVTNSITFGISSSPARGGRYTGTITYHFDTEKYSGFYSTYRSNLIDVRTNAEIDVATYTNAAQPAFTIESALFSSNAVNNAVVVMSQNGLREGMLAWKKLVNATGSVTFAGIGFIAMDPEHAAKPVPASPFTDVSPSAYYYDAVLWASTNGITSGTSATTFSPNKPCTRGQMVQFLYNLCGKPAVSGQIPFNDVSSSAYYYDAVVWASQTGITSGITPTTFAPNQPCTRAQMVQFLYSLSGKPIVIGSTLPFTDVPTNAYYRKAVIWARQTGITSGTSATTFSPDEACTRGQMVQFLYNLRGKE